MKKKINLKYPLYFKEFECIGGKCEDSCCIGWDIDIDKQSFRKYHKVDNDEMREMFHKNVHNNPDYTDAEIDYGKIKLNADKRCPFLDQCNYCIIYSKLGEDYLSNVCTHFPRVMNKVDGQFEISLDIACPEAARIILNKEEGIEFAQNDESINKYIISGTIDTKQKEYEDHPLRYFKEIRKFCLDLMKKREYTLNERMYVLGDFLYALEEECEYDCSNVLEFIDNYNIKEVASEYEKNSLNYILQISFFKNVVDSLNILEEIDSEKFKEATRELLQGLDIKDKEDLAENPHKYIDAFELYNEKYIDKYNYIFENYIVNFIYNNLFPFSESDSMFEGYIMLLVRYSFMKFYLAGKYMNNKHESKDDIVKFVQVFSKAIEHDKNYMLEVLDYIIENGYDNMEFAKMLIL